MVRHSILFYDGLFLNKLLWLEFPAAEWWSEMNETYNGIVDVSIIAKRWSGNRKQGGWTSPNNAAAGFVKSGKSVKMLWACFDRPDSATYCTGERRVMLLNVSPDASMVAIVPQSYRPTFFSWVELDVHHRFSWSGLDGCPPSLQPPIHNTVAATARWLLMKSRYV